MDTKLAGHLIEALKNMKSLNADMPVAQALSLLLIAKHEGLSLKELAERAGVGMASASRYVAAFGKPTGGRSQALGLVAAVEDPEERRKKVITLTPKGRAFINKLIGGQ